jgi:hypothetical protein
VGTDSAPDRQVQSESTTAEPFAGAPEPPQQPHNLAADPLTTGAPELDAPKLGLKRKPLMAGSAELGAGVHVLRASYTRHGPREEWGPLQRAQSAIIALYPTGIPKHINKAKLHNAANEWLEKQPGYSRKTDWLPRSTVVRALKKLQRL